MTDSLAQLRHWCVEAVNKYGDDWYNIHWYVHEKLAELTEADRAQFPDLIAALASESKEKGRYQS